LRNKPTQWDLFVLLYGLEQIWVQLMVLVMSYGLLFVQPAERGGSCVWKYAKQD
jgi:hypothetical protein